MHQNEYNYYNRDYNSEFNQNDKINNQKPIMETLSNFDEKPSMNM